MAVCFSSSVAMTNAFNICIFKIVFSSFCRGVCSGVNKLDYVMGALEQFSYFSQNYSVNKLDYVMGALEQFSYFSQNCSVN